MKKLLAVLLALVMLVSLAACAGNTDKDNPSSDAPANSDNPSMKANVNKKIAMIMQQGGLGDQGFNDTAYAGLMTCKEKYDLDVNAVECTDTTQGETLIRELCEAGYGLIINLEAGISGNMYTVARDYPDIYFVVVGRQLRINAVDGFTETPKNVIESYITLNEHSFLAGVVAAFAATDGNTLVEGVGQHEGCNIGILFGAESVGFYQYGDGFRQGALFYNPDAKVYMYCNHCLPCAKHINIAQLSKYLDMALLDGVTPTLQGHYDALEHHAGECIGCGRCETQCPFNVPIIQRMKQAAELFGK